MKVLTPGHCYELANFEQTARAGQTLHFIEKAPGATAPGDRGNELITVHDGTTNEEVLRVLIDRLKFLSAKLPSRETSIAITKSEEALMWLEKRTADRLARGVEGTRTA